MQVSIRSRASAGSSEQNELQPGHRAEALTVRQGEVDMPNTQDTNNATRLVSLVGKLKHPNFDVRITAARAIRDLSVTADLEDSLIPALIDALSDTEEYDAVSYVCASSLAAFAQRNEEVLRVVVDALDVRIWEAKCAAAYVIELIGPRAAAAVPKLASVLHKSIGPVKIRRCEALGSIGSAATAAIPALLNVLHNPTSLGELPRGVQCTEEDVQFSAAKALYRMGKEGRTALECVKDNEALHAVLERVEDYFRS
jgi:hypothetical protein